MKTEVFSIDPENFSLEELEQPARVLAGGGLVAFPTETVYGLGANAHDPQAVHRLCELKERPPQKPFTLHIADLSAVTQHVAQVSSAARRLMDRFWPGPLTLIIPGRADVGLGLRFPSHPVARALIRLAGCPVVAPSANPHGEEPATSGERVRELYEGKVEAIIDSGTTIIREASTVVKVLNGGIEIMREGLITAGMIERALLGHRILFVCTGNSCRSPMAAALFKKMLAGSLGVSSEELPDHGYHVQSAGTAAFTGGRASEHSIQAMATRGIDISGHYSRRLTEEVAREAEWIITMGHSHVWQILHWDPSLRDRVSVISELGISDPIGGSLDDYERCASEIEGYLEKVWLPRVLATGPADKKEK